MEPVTYNYLKYLKHIQQLHYDFFEPGRVVPDWNHYIVNDFYNSKNFQSLQEAVSTEDNVLFDECIKKMLKNSEHDNQQTVGIVIYLIISNHFEYLKIAVDAGIDVNKFLYVNINGIEGFRSPLQTAIVTNNLKAIDFLLDKGADINIINRESENFVNYFDDYISPLIFAIRYSENIDSRSQIIDYLIKRGSDINTDYDRDGLVVPLRYILENNYSTKMIATLLNLCTIKLSMENDSFLNYVTEDDKFYKKLDLLLAGGCDVHQSELVTTALLCSEFSSTCPNHCFIVKKHLIRVNCAEIDIDTNPIYSEYIEGEKYINWRNKCFVEINSMKLLYIGNTNLSFYHLLHLQLHRSSLRLKHFEERTLSNVEIEIENLFPIYKNLLKIKLGRAIHRRNMIRVFNNFLENVFHEKNIPNLFLWALPSYFSNTDLATLVAKISYNN